MTEHPSNSQLELLTAKALPASELSVVAKHLARCSTCRYLIENTVQQQRSSEPLAFTLAPEFWLRHAHVSYEHLLGIAERTWDETEKEFIDRHLTICSSCREDVSSFIAFREQVLPELDTSLIPIKTETPQRMSWPPNWLSPWRFNPAYAAATVVLVVVVLIAMVLLINRRTSNIAQQPPTPQISPAATPDSQASVTPSTIQSPTEQPNTEPVITLNDRNGPITVDKDAKVTGLDAVSADTRNDVAQVVLSERVDRAAILELKGEDSALRGTSKQPFKLYSPARTVIVSNRPTFRWEPVAGATTYTVYVTDRAGQVVATSDELPSDRKQWIVPKPLKRGGVFSWTVTAVVQGREVVAPGPSAPEMKFKVLSTAQLEELQQLKKTGSHLALGTFYADVGMLVEAEQEFQELLRLNPNSEVASKLLQKVRSVRP